MDIIIGVFVLLFMFLVDYRLNKIVQELKKLNGKGRSDEPLPSDY